jgi:hypothetical protein
MGSLSMAVITAWLGLPPEAIPAGGAAGSAAYLVGVFGPAFIEMLLARLRRANRATAMNELLRLARSLRCDPADPEQAFAHRLRIGLAVAALILILSLLR